MSSSRAGETLVFPETFDVNFRPTVSEFPPDNDLSSVRIHNTLLLNPRCPYRGESYVRRYHNTSSSADCRVDRELNTADPGGLGRDA
ncbi:hypothetical protein FRB94_008516 [Tulasnella sp. JGI-2019a]|nr:hypothetical protein FRB94_008516 [Tulasnella sp. JGI-2019a]